MKIGGYVKVDALADYGGTSDKYQFLISGIPVDGPGEAKRANYFNLFMRDTRFNFDMRKNITGYEPEQQVHIEMDFFDTSSSSPRLRHAYFVYGNLVAGQTWSTLVDTRSLPSTLDFAFGNVLYSGRLVQVRWQQPWGEHWSWAAAMELPSSQGINNPYGLPGTDNVSAPALVARTTYEDSRRVVMVGASVGRLGWDGQGQAPDASATQWALVVSGRQYVGENNYFTGIFSYGDGTAEYITSLAGSSANATLTLDGKLETSEAANASLGYTHKFSPSLSTNIAYAWTGIQDSDLRVPNDISIGEVTHVNLIWSVDETLSTGIEYMWGYRENVDGRHGDAARLQAMVKYGF